MRKFKSITAMVVLTLVLSFLSVIPVSADVAPPQPPTGGGINPGEEVTQVRMLRETVTMNVISDAPVTTEGQVSVNAIFVMRNLGDTTEFLNVRFPLNDPSGFGDGWDGMPEIKDFRVEANGQLLKTTRITTPNPLNADYKPVPWASFLIAFPPGEDVVIDVLYKQDGQFADVGYVGFNYILETGAGWKDTIGSADIVVHLPYEASSDNFSSTYEFGQPIFSGNEVRWRLENFEPDSGYNFSFTTVKPKYWLPVLMETEKVTKNPNDGEAWGRLGKAYKTVMLGRKYYLTGTESMYQKAVAAYEKAVTLKPEDALWHAGFAELLWLGASDFANSNDQVQRSTIIRALSELDMSLRLDPNNKPANYLAEYISSWGNDYIEKSQNGYVIYALTATPELPTSVPVETETPVPTDTSAPIPPTREPASLVPLPTATLAKTASVPPTAAPQKTGVSPVCGGAALIFPAIAGLFWVWPRIKMLK
jgi:hypothetical protein